MPLPELVNTSKSLAVTPVWAVPDERDGYTWFQVPLSIDGVVEAGLTLGAGAYANIPDRHVTFELAVDGPKRTRLIRLDWRSLKGGHSNHRRKCSGALSGLRVPATHLHSFEANFDDKRGRMKSGKLPCAEPVKEDLPTFEEVRRFVGTSFRINNIELVPVPPWEYDLFNA
ncbi:hypothetical protein ABIF00_005624 [Bradyrhizobium elkanii]